MILLSRKDVAATPWKVSRDWEGETCAVLASGPSMSQHVADSVRGKCRVIAVSNQGIETVVDGVTYPALAPWADVMLASDRRWWIENEVRARAFAGLKVTVEPPGGCERLHFSDVLQLKNGGEILFDDRPTHVGGGGNSGFHSVHLAAHLGCAKILLCGFDMKPMTDAHGKKIKQHWFGEHEWRKEFTLPFDLFVDRFTRSAPEFLKRGIRVINCTPDSALKCFPFMTVEEALRC